jgi:hypothetical protein
MERMADVFLTEADPDCWSGNGVLPCDMTKEERGNRHWDKKGAAATAVVMQHAIGLIKWSQSHETLDEKKQADLDADLDKHLIEAERRAAQAVDRAMARAKGRMQTHGKTG